LIIDRAAQQAGHNKRNKPAFIVINIPVMRNNEKDGDEPGQDVTVRKSQPLQKSKEKYH
jgi:hypothetical protein